MHITNRKSKKKIWANLDHYCSKKYSFLCVQANCFCLSETLEIL